MEVGSHVHTLALRNLGLDAGIISSLAC